MPATADYYYQLAFNTTRETRSAEYRDVNRIWRS